MLHTGKVALVTGASRGIGRAIAENLASQGAKVVGTATTESGAAAITAYLNGAGTGQVLDVTAADSVDQLLTTLADTVGMPQILVNNAGITRDNLMLRMSDEEWAAVIQTNLTAVFKVTRACLKPMFRARWGRIVNISSVVGVTGNIGQANYAAAKAGVIAMSKSLAMEMASRHITVNVVAPGFIDTDMTNGLSEDIRAAILANVPMKRLGEPADIANAVGFLASDLAAYITGETIHVNGGMYMA